MEVSLEGSCGRIQQMKMHAGGHRHDEQDK